MKDTFSYRFKIKTSDLWQASMYYAYSSYMGVVNAVCIAASVILLLSRWNSSGDLFRTVMLFFFLLFTVIQPLAILIRARASVSGSLHELALTFTKRGITVIADGQRQEKSWKDVKGIVKRPTIMILYMEDGGGYILRNSVLEKTRGMLYDFVMKMLSENKKGHA